MFAMVMSQLLERVGQPLFVEILLTRNVEILLRDQKSSKESGIDQTT